MKMLFLTDKFPPSEGGSRIYYYNLCKHYPQENVIVLTKKVEGYEEFDRQQPFRIIRQGKPLPNWKYHQLPRMVPTLLWTIFLLFKEKIQIIHCGDDYPATAIGLLIKKIFKIPYVYYEHGEGITWGKQYRFQPKIRKLFLKNAAAVVAACSYAEEGVKRELHEIGDKRGKIFKITPGVDHERLKPEWKDEDLKYGIGLHGEKIILTLGRLIERKGQDTVIRAMPQILAAVPDTVYLIAGRGPYELSLRVLVSDLHLEKYVRFLGFVSHEKIPGLFSICDIFVMINRDTLQDGPEGFGMVFAEASAAGKPVIGGKSGGTEDSIMDGVTGYRVDPYDVDEVAACIVKVLKDPELARRLGKNGREWVVKHCDWREKSKQLEAVNRSICG